MARAAEAISARADELLPLVIAETGATAAVGSSSRSRSQSSRFERYSLDLRPVARRAAPPQVAEATPLAPGGLISALAAAPACRRGGVHHVVQLPARQHGGQGGAQRSPWATPSS